MSDSLRKSRVNLRDGDGTGKSEQVRILRELEPRMKKGRKYVADYTALEERDDALNKIAMEDRESESDIDDIESSLTDSETDIRDVLGERVRNIKREFYGETPKEGPHLIINEYKQQILSLIANHQAIVLTGPTGCGKSTQVPLFILDSCMEKDEYCNIVVTQPRRIAATSVTKRVCSVRDWALGSICGFKVGLVDRTGPQTLLTYMTTGVLLQTLIKRRSLSQYTHLIIDEIHERDQSLDLLLIVIKTLVKLESSNVKIVLMSATAGAEKFSRYFSRKCGNELIPAPIMKIDGPTSYIVDVFYLDDLPFVQHKLKLDRRNPHISEEIYGICVKLIKSFEEAHENEEGKSSVLIFLPGINEIEHLYYKLKDPNVIGDGDYKWHLLPLHSSISVEDHSGIFRPAKPGYRKIIISTNLAESSVTVPGVKYVIDFCTVKRLKCDPTENVHGLQLFWASQSNCIQRAGRTGRVMDGQVYRMVSKEFYETLDEQSPSELSESPLEKTILQIKVFDMGEPLAILARALDPPDLADIEWSILILKETGALLRESRGVYTPHDGELTFLGRLMAALPVDMYIAKLMAMGHIFGCLTECIIMGAAMSVKNAFAYPFSDRLKAYDMKYSWSENSSSDCIALLNLYEVWTEYRKSGRFAGSNGDSEARKWTSTNFVHLHVLGEIDALVRELKLRLEEFQIQEPFSRPHTTGNDYNRVLFLKVALAGAFYPHYFSTGFRYGNTYEKEATIELGGRDPLRTVVLQSFPRNQPVKIYYNLIGNYFKSMGYDVRLSSNNRTRIYVEFRHLEPRMRLHGENNFDETAPTEILREVYRAVKIGQITKHTRIKLLPDIEADRQAYRVGASSWNILRPEYKPTTQNYIPCPLPSLNVSRVNITISHIVNPGHFWALYADKWSEQELLFSTIMDSYPTLQRFESTPVPGQMCIAPIHINGKTLFQRARIENVDLENPRPYAEVFFVDHGSCCSIEISDLRKYGSLTEELEVIPGQAFECILSEIRPSSVRDVKGLWTRAGLAAFQNIIKGGKLYGDIYSVVSGVVSLVLYRIEEKGKNININEFLINEKYAETAEETKFSKINHSLRSEPRLNETLNVDFNKMQEGQFWGPYPKSAELESVQLTQLVKLRGPKSPLEMILYACPRISSCKNVVIAEDSVNSVLLYTEPADRHDRLVLAGNMSQTSASSNLYIHNVTVMPNIHGLAALIPIIFCPEAEFRLNKEKSRLTGVLCGLGADHHGRSFFPDHDMEIQFDAEITPEDIVMVNALRYHMNQLLKASDVYQQNWTIIKHQTTARKIVLMLLRKDRPSSALDLYGMDYRWNRLSSSVSVHGKLKKRDAMWSYPMHATPFLYGNFY